MKETIKGDGSSLWGESSGTYNITSAKVRVYDYYLDPDNIFTNEGQVDESEDKTKLSGELQLFGENTNWYQYTDDRISKEVNASKVIRDEVLKQVKMYHPNIGVKDVEWIVWSEQGMQPDNGWSFDVSITVER